MAKTAITPELTEKADLSNQIDLLIEQYDDDKNIEKYLFELGRIFYAQEKHLPESLAEFVTQNYVDATQYTTFLLRLNEYESSYTMRHHGRGRPQQIILNRLKSSLSIDGNSIDTVTDALQKVLYDCNEIFKNAILGRVSRDIIMFTDPTTERESTINYIGLIRMLQIRQTIITDFEYAKYSITEQTSINPLDEDALVILSGLSDREILRPTII